MKKEAFVNSLTDPRDERLVLKPVDIFFVRMGRKKSYMCRLPEILPVVKIWTKVLV